MRRCRIVEPSTGQFTVASQGGASYDQEFPADMKIHEYQAKSILARHGVPVPRGEIAFDAADAGATARRLGGSIVVVKAKPPAGGRGRGGGEKLAKSPEEAERLA